MEHRTESAAGAAVHTVPAVRLAGVSKRFNGTQAVASASLQVSRGAIFALLGPSGCGKTTTLRLIAGFGTPDAGSIELNGATAAGPDCFVPPELRQVGMVFQDYALFPHMSVGQNVAFGLGRGYWGLVGRLRKRIFRADTAQQIIERRTDEVLEMVGLAGMDDRMPFELSGGEQQRVALARALAPEPSLLLLDEPFSNLDTSLRDRVRTDVHDILRQSGCATILVTHDQDEAFAMADKVAVMFEGRIHQSGAPDDVYANPASLQTATFLGEANVLDGTADGETVETALGRLSLKSPARGNVRVTIRPDSISARAGSGQSKGVVTGHALQGPYHVSLVEIAEGQTVSVRERERTHQLGESVQLEVMGPVSAFPAR